MNKKQGLTLIEIIISIAILGIIAIVFLGSMSNHFVMLTKSKNITANLFSTQKDVENEMENIRSQLWVKGKLYKINDEIYINSKKYRCKNQHTSNIFANETAKWQEIPFDKTSYKVDDLFGENLIDINTFKIEKSYGSKKIFTLIAQGKMEFEVPVITSFSALLKPNDISKTKNYVYALSDSKIESVYTLDTSTQDVFMKNLYNWYESREGFNIKLPKKENITEIEWKEKYPRTVDDFKVIPGETGDTLSNLESYKGKHLILAATPASKVGKLGNIVYSEPIFISGLPVINNNLKLHLDASLIDISDANLVSESGSDLYLKTWKDISENNDVSQTNPSRQPRINDIKFGEIKKGSDIYPIYARTLSFDGINDFMTLGKNSLNGTSFFADKYQEFTIIVVAKANSSGNNQTFISKSGGWGTAATYSMGVSSGYFQQVIRGENIKNISPGNNGFNIHVTQWDRNDHRYWINSDEKLNHSNIGNASNQGNNIVIGAAAGGDNSYLNGEIAEVIVYNRALGDSERIDIEEYLSKKYVIAID